MTQPIDTDLVLDATRQCIIENGAKSVTLTQIANAAGISRMTIYRKWSNFDRLVIETTDREMRTCLTQAIRDLTTGNARQRCVAMILKAIELFQENPVIRSVLADNYDIFQIYLIERTGQAQGAFLMVISKYLTAGIKDGSIGVRDVNTAAYVLLFTLQNFVSAHSILEKETNYRNVLHELRVMLDCYLKHGAIK